MNQDTSQTQNRVSRERTVDEENHQQISHDDIKIEGIPQAQNNQKLLEEEANISQILQDLLKKGSADNSSIETGGRNKQDDYSWFSLEFNDEKTEYDFKRQH